MKHFWPLILLLLLPAAQADRFSDLEDCILQVPGGLLTAQARCGSLQVPENPDDPDGRVLTLAYAVVQAPTGRPQPDPVVYLAGGPGQSAREMLPLMRVALRQVNRDRDLIFLDQRGTGASNPLRCDFSAVDPFLEPDPEAMTRLYRECLEELDADPRFYTSAHAAGDLDALRAHLGYDTLNLVGTSYGTRLAQVYLRHYPDRVRSLILDGVVPVRLALGSEHGRALDGALARILDACAQDPDCDARFPDLPGALATLRSEQEAAGARRLTLTHPRTGQPREMDFDRDGLAQTLRMLAYAPQTQALLPLLIDEAAQQRTPDRLANQLMQIYEQLDEMIAVGLEAAIGCSEDWPVWRELDPEAETGTLLGAAMREARARVCEIWPAGDVADDFHEPFTSDVPMLLLSGELDPVTPPEYGNEAAASYPNSRHLVARGQGHGTLTPPCTSRIAAEFLRTLEPWQVDVDCMERIGPTPFFLDLLGPGP